MCVHKPEEGGNKIVVIPKRCQFIMKMYIGSSTYGIRIKKNINIKLLGSEIFLMLERI